MTITITDAADVRVNDLATLRKGPTQVEGPTTDCPGNVHVSFEDPELGTIRVCTDNGWRFVSATREAPEYAPGQTGTATVRGVGRVRVMRVPGAVSASYKFGWVDQNGVLSRDDYVTDFVPDEAPRPLPSRAEFANAICGGPGLTSVHTAAADRVLALLTGGERGHGDKCGDPSCDC
jgi:hypothetical protein